MPYKRRYGKKSTRSKKRPMRKRKLAIPRQRYSTQVHAYRRKFLHETVSTSGTGIPVSKGYHFHFSQIPNVTEFTQLYDQFKILNVKVTFRPRYNVSTTESASHGHGSIPSVHYLVDKDSASQPSNVVNTFLENTSARSLWLSRPRTVSFKPTVLDQIYESSLSTAYSPRKAPWIDCADTAAQHYGLRYICETEGWPANTPFMDVFVEFAFMMRNPR